MAITKVTEGVRTLGTGEVLTANMDTDPTNASNLSSGSVPLAQLGNVDTSGITANADDIALLGFKVASNGSLAKYNLVDQAIDDFQDTSGVDASASTNEVRDATGKYYSGTVAGAVSGYTSSGTHTGARTGTAEVLVVAGGGGAGGADAEGGRSGAGGAGGLVYHATYPIVLDVVYDFTIGAGAVGGAGTSAGNNGSNSSWNDNDEGSESKMTALGGGGGGQNGVPGGGSNGGSGGGGGKDASSGGTSTQGDSGGGTGFGFAGGAGSSSSGGGSGGAGAVGAGGSGGTGGDGGIGKQYTSFGAYGTDVSNSTAPASGKGYFAGGGGGAGSVDGSGAAGGGGDGTGGSGESGADNTGGGAGGAEGSGAHVRSGGSGFVGIKYADLYNDMTLISVATTAEATPTKGDIVFTINNDAGTATINTDVKAYVSRDNGTTYTQFTLADQGTTGGHNILTAHDLDISGQPSGTSMRYKIETLNQSVSKATFIQAVSLGWS